MPELPEVEVLVRRLRPRVVGQRIAAVEILHPRTVWRTTPTRLSRALVGKRIASLGRRAKYLRFGLEDGDCFLVHLGMTGRLRLTKGARREAHDVVRICLGRRDLVLHDVRKFGHVELGDGSLRRCGPEPLGPDFNEAHLAGALRRSRAPIKVRLLDQKLVAGLGNIYACEALWRARINPRRRCCRLGPASVRRLRQAIIGTLLEAIRVGGGLSLDFDSVRSGDGLFYYGSGRRRNNPSEHFAVYDREARPCRRCGEPIARIQQGGRSTFYCRHCQV